MTPEELCQCAEDVIKHSNSNGVPTENAAEFIEQLQARLREIATWIPPVYGSMGYADTEIVNRVRQIKFMSEGVMAHFPAGVEALSRELESFRQYLMANYPIRS